ncbi:hypothetical protein BCR41DRAFT_293603, partial [Lobosporangium transversale]
LFNCVEPYGRKQSIDAHKEPFLLSNGNALQTSIPPFETRHIDLWPTTIPCKKGDRLVIGTQAFNVLITSSARLDIKEPPSLGGVTTSFTLKESKLSRNTKIFLDSDSVIEAFKIINSKEVYRNARGNELEQMRQVRSKFDHCSPYFLCRAASNIAKSHLMQPYSVFTLVGH